MIRRPFLALIACLVGTATGFAAPRDELLRLVPESVGFCLVVQDMRGQAAAFRESHFFKQVQASSLGEALAGAPEFGKLLEAEKKLQEHLGVDFTQLRDDILGDAVVLAYQPGPPGKPEEEQGLLLVRVAKPDLLDKLIERIDAVQKQSGELKEIRELAHGGKKYQRRVKSKDADDFFYRSGPILAFSAREAMIQKAIDLDGKAPAAGRDPSPVAEQLQGLGAERGFVSLWVNPRAFDADLSHKVQAAKGAEAAFLTQFQVYWKVLDGLALYTGNGPNPELNVALRGNLLALPKPAMKLFLEASRPSALWASFPDNALLAVGGRLDPAALQEMIGEFLTEDARRQVKSAMDRAGRVMFLGRDLSTEVLPLLGPDWGFSVLAPPLEDKAWFPHAVGGLRVQPGNKQPPLDKAILGAINSFLLFGMLDYNIKNAQPVTLRVENQDKIEVRYLTSDGFPPGLQPALGLKDGYLVAASSPAAFRRFQAKPAVGLPGLPGASVPLVRLSLKDLRTYLKDRREALVAFISQKNQLTADEANRRLDRLLAGLDLFDKLDLTQQFSLAGNVTWTVRLQPAPPQVLPNK